MKFVMILLQEEELYVFFFTYLCGIFSSRVYQIVDTYVKPRHPNVIDTHDTWHCIRAIVAGVEEILLAGGAPATAVEGLKDYMKTLLLALLVKYPGEPQRVAKEWLTFDWNRNGFSFSKDELLMLFDFAKGKVSQVLKLSSLATSIAESYNNHNLVHWSKKVVHSPVVWKIKCLCAWFQWNQIPDWFSILKQTVSVTFGLSRAPDTRP